MKSIHPTYYPETAVICACGHSFTTGSTKKSIKVDVCSACHPFFTGQMKFVDTQGRVERFQAKMVAATGYKKKPKTRKASAVSTLSLKEMFKEAKKKTS